MKPVMKLSSVELLLLADRALENELSPKETKRLLKALCDKFLKMGLDSPKIRILLSAYVLFEKRYDSILRGNKKARRKYIKRELAEWREIKT